MPKLRYLIIMTVLNSAFLQILFHVFLFGLIICALYSTYTARYSWVLELPAVRKLFNSQINVFHEHYLNVHN